MFIAGFCNYPKLEMQMSFKGSMVRETMDIDTMENYLRNFKTRKILSVITWDLSQGIRLNKKHQSQKVI